MSDVCEAATHDWSRRPVDWSGPSSRCGICSVIALVLTVVAAAALSLPPPAAASALVTPIAVTVLNRPNPVLGADRRHHLVYELKVANLSSDAVTVDSVEARAGGKPFGARLEGRRLAANFRSDNLGTGTTMQPGVGATIFMDVTYAARSRPPAALTHRLVVTVRDPSGAKPPRRLSFTGVRTPVYQGEAIEVASPLRGKRWLVGNGCCGITAHSGATLPIDGTIHTPERFAIDFVQLNAHRRLFSGPKNKLSSYAFYGARIHAVADGTVVGIQAGLRDQTPGVFPAHPTIQTAGGNYVVERIGEHRYAFYAHMQPGSLRVKKGDRVRTGQVIGLLGNSGNSDAPHLHFHLMDSPSPLKSNGLPFTFKSFKGQGVVEDEAPVFAGDPAPINRNRFAGPHRDQLPLNDQLIDLGR